MNTADAINRTLQSVNVLDSNLEPANVVDVIDDLALAVGRVAKAITSTAEPGTDATGGHVECLTEAVMGLTAGMCRIADAIDNLAQAYAGANHG